MEKEFDIIIIGGGPIGIACGLEAIKHGLSYIVLEKGCLVNSLYHYPQNMTFFSTSEKTGDWRDSICIEQYKTHKT